MYSAVKSSKGETNETFTRQGSLRKVLLAEHKEKLFGRQNEDLNQIYRNFQQEYAILAEYKMIQSQEIPGIYVIPSRENQFLWFGVIYVRSGPYEDGIFRFNVILNENFPDAEHPKVVFSSEIFHPVINVDNELHLKDAFPSWSRSEQHIWQVLKYLHWIFYNLEHSLAHSVNKEAAEMYKSDKSGFLEKVQNLCKVSQERIYDESNTEDKNYLVFAKYNPEIHDQSKSAMLTQNKDEPTKMGYSWVLPGSTKSLERPSTPDSESES